MGKSFSEVVTVKETFLFSHWPVEVHRRAFRRSVSIYLYPNRPIKVMASKTTQHQAILDFLTARHDWIQKNFLKFSEHAEKFPDKKIKAREDFPFLGISRKLKVVITLQKKPFVSLTEQELLLHIPRNEWSASALVEEHPTALKEIRHFYKRESVRLLSQRLEYWVKLTGLKPTTVKFREQRTRWGSCSSRKAINLNWRLIVFPQTIIDYVIIHELCHLQHMDHSPKFWGLVEKFCPDFKDHMAELKESQALVEFLSEKA